LNEAPRYFVHELCKDHSPVKETLFSINEWNFIDHHKGDSPTLPFDLGELRVAVAALRANAVDAKSCRIAYEEHIEENDKKKVNITSIITWLEKTNINDLLKLKNNNTQGQYFDAFIDRIKESCRTKGLHRGLPQVLLFGIENNAVLIEVYLDNQCNKFFDHKHNGNKWDFSTTKEKEYEDYNYRWRFVFQGEFDKPSSEKKEHNEHKATTSYMDVTEHLLYLVDDKVDSEWRKQISSSLTSFGFGEDRIKYIDIENDGCKYARWKTIINDDTTKYFVVTDSQFFKNQSGGQDLLIEIARESNGAFSRGLVYSADPRLQKDKLVEFKIDQLNKSSNYAEDARQIACFLKTGKLDPIGPLLEMMRRFIRVLDISKC
jgi:hypothetical protein